MCACITAWNRPDLYMGSVCICVSFLFLFCRLYNLNMRERLPRAIDFMPHTIFSINYFACITLPMCVCVCVALNVFNILTACNSCIAKWKYSIYAHFCVFYTNLKLFSMKMQCNVFMDRQTNVPECEWTFTRSRN